MTRRSWLVLSGLIALAFGLRLAFLSLRPPHHDEGVNGWFIEQMLAKGYYAYDPRNYHGPSYFYLLAAVRELCGFGLWQLRLPTALIGGLLCLAPLALRRRLGVPTALAAAAVLATSPTLVYFARYAIHETLLVALLLVLVIAAVRWADGGRAAWIVVGGAALALMVATKETTILLLAAVGPWLVVETVRDSRRAGRLCVLGRAPVWDRRAALVAAGTILVMAAIHVTLFTGGFRAPGSTGTLLSRSTQAYALWADTGTRTSGHVKSAWYYLQLGARYELALYALAAIGLVAGFRERWLRGPGVVGFTLLGGYSLIGYKMPWLPMSWLVLLALPAGRGALVVVAAARRARLPVVVTAVALAAAPLAIAVRSSFVRPADKREALAYVHTSSDYAQWMALIDRGAARVGKSRLRIAVAHDVAWPLPWALKPFPRTRWSVRGDEDVMIVARSRAADIEPKLRDAYYRRSYRVRASAEPAFLYLRRSLYRGIVGVAPAGFDVVGRDRIDALARQQIEGPTLHPPSGRVVPGLPLWIDRCTASST